jgi:hypothetical protein
MRPTCSLTPKQKMDWICGTNLCVRLDNDHQVTTKRNLWKHNMKHDAMNKFICRFFKTLVVTKMKHYNYLIDRGMG